MRQLGFLPSVSMSAPTSKAPSICVQRVFSREDLVRALEVRKRVFVDEMGIQNQEEFDRLDVWPVPSGIAHFLVSVESRAIATCRVNSTMEPNVKLERMAVEKFARRKGVGLALLRHVEQADIVAESPGPLYCYAMKDKELFYRNSGFTVEEGHGAIQDAGIPHVAMLKRRKPRGCPPSTGPESLSHIMIRTWDIRRARRFYSLLGYQDVRRFLTNGVKAAWIKSPWIDQKIELIEVKDLLQGNVQKESLERFSTKLRILEKPREILLGSIITEMAFMTDADGTVIELMRFIRRLDDKIEYDAQW